MQDTDIVSRVKPGANLSRKLDRFVYGKPADASQKGRELFAFDEFHREELASIRFADVVNAADIFVSNLSCDPHFTMKARERRPVGQQMIGQKL